MIYCENCLALFTAVNALRDWVTMGISREWAQLGAMRMRAELSAVGPAGAAVAPVEYAVAVQRYLEQASLSPGSVSRSAARLAAGGNQGGGPRVVVPGDVAGLGRGSQGRPDCQTPRIAWLSALLTPWEGLRGGP
jgi:hypothetical protein